ncbi:DMT family transporter [Arthrobacter pigmenti]
MFPSRHIPLSLGLPLMLLGGAMLPLQGRINGALAIRIDDTITASLVSFYTGLLVMLLITLILPRGRAGFRQIVPTLRERRVPRWYLLAGISGGYFVLMQAGTISVLGVAVFTVAVVAGQSLSSLLVDRIGIGPGGRRRITFPRLGGAVLTLTSVVVALSPRFGAGSDSAALILLVLLPLLAGLFSSAQHAMNGSAAVAYGTPITATTLNFMLGAAVLTIIWVGRLWIFGGTLTLPDEWWYYLGGPLGTIFVGMTTLLVRTMGILLASLGMIAGQLLGSLALDIFVPTAGTVIAPATVVGTLLTLGAVVFATLPWRRPVHIRPRVERAADPSRTGR